MSAACTLSRRGRLRRGGALWGPSIMPGLPASANRLRPPCSKAIAGTYDGVPAHYIGANAPATS